MSGVGIIELIIIGAIVAVPLLVLLVILLVVASRRPKSDANVPCPRCGAPIPARAEFCPQCGRPPA